MTVFLCDGLRRFTLALASTLSFNPSATAVTAAARFFAVAFRLRMELQMVLCHRIVGSTKQNVLRKDSESAFQSLAKILNQNRLLLISFLFNLLTFLSLV